MEFAGYMFRFFRPKPIYDHRALPATPSKLNWLDENTIDFGDCAIEMHFEEGGSKKKSSDKHFIMMKAKSYTSEYEKLTNERFRHILEIGIYQGGGYVFLDKLFKPEKMSALDLSDTPLPALSNYVLANRPRTHLHQGVSQDNVRELKRIVNKDLDGFVDLVVDDASHWYEPTKASFATVFPMMAPGGLYLIEDWDWVFGDFFQTPDAPWRDANGVPNIMIDLMEEYVLGEGLIASIEVKRPFIAIRRSDRPAAEMFKKLARRGRAVSYI